MKHRDDSPEGILIAAGITWKKSGPNEVRFPCPHCGVDEGFDMNLKTGMYRCKRASCGKKGGTYTLKVALGLAYDVAPAKEPEGPTAEEMAAFIRIESEVDRMHRFLCSSKPAEKAREYLDGRGLTTDLWAFARLGFYPRIPGVGPAKSVKRHGLIGIPYLDPTNKTKARAVKLRWVPPEPKRKGKKWRYTRVVGGESVLFAPYGIHPKKAALLVGGELDALSVCQVLIDAKVSSRELSWFVVSIPDGESSWTATLTAELAEIEDVVVCFDDDAAGKKGADTVAEAIGRWRCRQASWPDGEKDANEALVAGKLSLEVLEAMVKDATSYAAESVVSAYDLIEEVLDYIFIDRAGRGWPTGLEGLDDLIGGWRPGEVTVVSGGSGAGKTTFCAQMVAAQLLAGRKCLVIPLEGGFKKFMMKLTRQLIGLDPRERTRHEARMRLRECLPNLYITKEAEKFDPKAFVETYRYCIAQLGIQFGCLDHISFAIERDKDRWEKQNSLILDLQLVTQVSDVHLLVVAHPKKVRGVNGEDRDDFIVQMSDLKGQSEIFQDLANFLSMYRPRKANREPYIDKETGHYQAACVVGKCRDEDGDEGGVELLFDKSAGRYYDAPTGTSTTTTTSQKKQEKFEFSTVDF